MMASEDTIVTCANCDKGEESSGVRHVIWSSIATESVKLHIVPYTKGMQDKRAAEFCSKSINLLKVVQSAFFPYH